MTTLRVALLHLRVGVMNDMQYRVNFALQVLQSILAVTVGLVVFQLVFSHTTELNGWTHSELLAVLGVQAVMAGVIHSVIQPNMMRLTEEVREGKLDYALTKPVDSQMLVSVREVQLWQAVDVLTGGVVIGAAAMRVLLGLTEPPSAVFAENDLMAIGALDTVRELGRTVPADVAIVGYDDIEAAEMTSPRLTTVINPAYEAGREAARLLLDRMIGAYDGPARAVALRSELVIRDSS